MFAGPGRFLLKITQLLQHNLHITLLGCFSQTRPNLLFFVSRSLPTFEKNSRPRGREYLVGRQFLFGLMWLAEINSVSDQRHADKNNEVSTQDYTP